MRIGINGRFLTAPETGVQRFAREVARRLCARVDAVLLVPADAPPSGEPVMDETAVSGGLRGVAWEQVELPLAARRARVDVLLHPANAAPRWGGPHVVVLHDLRPLVHPEDFGRAYRGWSRFAHLGAARRAAAVATVSAWSARHLAGALGRDASEIPVVAQGAAPLDRPATEAAVAATRARRDLPGPYVLAAVGGDARKGLAFLHRVWSGWRDPDRPALVVVGRARGRAHRRREQPLGPDVRTLGGVGDEELRALLGGAVALLHPSGFEGFGRPPLEALACGTPAVVAPYGPASEVLGDAARIVPLEPDAWREAVRALLDETDVERAVRVERGRARAAMHRWEDGIDTLLALCTRVAGEG